MNNKEMMELRPELDSQFDELVKYCMASGVIDSNLYIEYDVKRGLRESNGKGVLTGLTEISDVVGFDVVDGDRVPCDGRLYFQGYNVQDLIRKGDRRRFAFEEATYLLLFGALPTREQLRQFIDILGGLRELSGQFVRDVIMKAPSSNIMNALEKSIVTLYSYDEMAEDISVPNVLRQALQLIAKMPVISVFAYQSYMHFKMDDVLIIRNPDPQCSTAENILRMLRPDGKYTELEAKVLDVALVLHAEHGGGNNSTFTTHVVTSERIHIQRLQHLLHRLRDLSMVVRTLRLSVCLMILRNMYPIGKMRMLFANIFRRYLISRLSTMPDLFTVSDMRYIHYQTRVRLFLRNMPSVCPRRRVLSKSLSFMTGLRE